MMRWLRRRAAKRLGLMTVMLVLDFSNVAEEEHCPEQTLRWARRYDSCPWPRLPVAGNEDELINMVGEYLPVTDIFFELHGGVRVFVNAPNTSWKAEDLRANDFQPVDERTFCEFEQFALALDACSTG